MERWRYRLAEFSFGIRFIEGSANVIANALSRIGHITRVASQAAYSIEEILDDRFDPAASNKGEDLSPEDRLKLIQHVHGSVLTGHPGRNASCEALKTSGYDWVGMQDDVGRFIKACPVCQKHRLRSLVAYHSGHLMTNTPFESVSIDSIGPLPMGPDGEEHILVMIDIIQGIMATVGEYTDWPAYIPVVQFIMNTTVHSATNPTTKPITSPPSAKPAGKVRGGERALGWLDGRLQHAARRQSQGYSSRGHRPSRPGHSPG